MRIRLIDIGNSKGIQLPKTLIKKYHLDGHIQLEKLNEGLLIKSVSKPRESWEELFKESYKKDNEIKDWKNNPNKFDEEEWTWC